MSSITNEAMHLSTDELMDLHEGMDVHLEAEEQAYQGMQKSMDSAPLFEERFIWSMLMDDRSRIDRMRCHLNEIKVEMNSRS